MPEAPRLPADTAVLFAALVAKNGLSLDVWDFVLAYGADQYRQGFAAGKRLDAAVTVAMQEADAR
jgi:hypothetical protein